MKKWSPKKIAKYLERLNKKFGKIDLTKISLKRYARLEKIAKDNGFDKRHMAFLYERLSFWDGCMHIFLNAELSIGKARIYNNDTDSDLKAKYLF